MQAIQTLNARLKKAKTSDRIRILYGVYKQLATSNKGRQTNGQFRVMAEEDPEQACGLAYFVAENLDKYGLPDHASRLREQHPSTFDYETLEDGSIVINIKGSPQKVLEAIAQASYEASRPVGMGAFQPYNTPSNEMDFSELVDVNARRGDVLSMDYVNGRQCKTFIHKDRDGRYIFRSCSFERDRGDPTPVLKAAQSLLKASPKKASLDEIVDYDRVYHEPTEKGTLPMNIATERLRRIGEIAPEMDIMVQDFARLFADYLGDGELVPAGVVMSVQYLKYDLEKGVYGIGKLTGQPIRSSLVGQPPVLYALMEMHMEKAMHKIFPKWFADGITSFYDGARDFARKEADRMGKEVQ